MAKKSSHMTPLSSPKPFTSPFAARLNQEVNCREFFKLIREEGCRRLEAEMSSVFLLDKGQQELWSPVQEDGKFLRLDARLGIAGHCLSTGEIINVQDVQSDDRFFSGIDLRTKRRTRNLLAIPLRLPNGEIFGVFEAVNKKTQAFSAKDERLAQRLVEEMNIPLQKMFQMEILEQERKQLEEENAQLWVELERRFSTQNLIGNSLPMQQLVRLIDQIRNSSVEVLITGENGTGKELVAKAIHYSSLRRRHPFIDINCAALPDNLIESELLGIGRGTATGVEAKIGKFVQAHQGTLFLDEIGDLGLKAQAKILRVLEERVVVPVGERTPIPIDIRVVSATNANLEEAMKKGTFREDLYYRLKVVHIQTPALRDIPIDIPLLANYFLDQHCQKLTKPRKKISSAAMRRLAEYDWPGNMRQLSHEMNRLAVMVRGTTINEEALDLAIKKHSLSRNTKADSLERKSLPEILGELEEQIIKDTLMACQFNQVRTAEKLGISRQGLIKKINRYKIRVKQMRDDIYKSL